MSGGTAVPPAVQPSPLPGDAVPDHGPSDAVLAERVRERLHPEPGDQAYAHLSDLLLALRQELPAAKGTWLDYGAGTSPYRGLLRSAELRTADLKGSERYAVDFELDDDGGVPAADGEFDGVLSTQVLEHVRDPSAYLAESFRLLRPGGRLILTTHGVWEDHGGVDLWRWTSDGLALQAERAGFAVRRCAKLTCGPRALVSLTVRHGRTDRWPGGELAGRALRTVSALERLRHGAFDRWSDRVHSGLRIVDEPSETVFLAILLVAERPVALRPDHTSTR